ncbi:MAG: PDDEXK nuclease domain-containing protein [Methanobrevibacter sp.]|jgi:predicted nuclease of restriction endonuclease-like (RecB) superfamily|nr:PDDEXK nuclease domain-containing protein [Candidatus Methanoflexus mossambicus]
MILWKIDLKSVNVELINLYWEIGMAINSKASWGKSIVVKLSKELQNEFPGIKGFSVSNIWNMVKFYKTYNGDEKLQPLVGEISWTKHVLIMEKCKDSQMREFYILATKKFGWSKNVLIHQIETNAYERFLINQTNYDETISNEIKNRASIAVKDEYIFDFLDLSENYSEKEMEFELVKNIRKFLLEMGSQFTFIGNQYKLELGDKEYFIDLLLFHRQLKCLVAIELKIGEFIPEYKGKMEFYLEILNDKVKLPDENDSIGIIICKEKNRTVVEYSLRSSKLPICVASYETSSKLPKDYENLLPSNEEIAGKMDYFFKSKDKNL